MNKQNPEYVSVPYKAVVLTPSGELKVITESPGVKDGEYSNGEGITRFFIKEGKVVPVGAEGAANVYNLQND